MYQGTVLCSAQISVSEEVNLAPSSTLIILGGPIIRQTRYNVVILPTPLSRLYPSHSTARLALGTYRETVLYHSQDLDLAPRRELIVHERHRPDAAWRNSVLAIFLQPLH